MSVNEVVVVCRLDEVTSVHLTTTLAGQATNEVRKYPGEVSHEDIIIGIL